MTALAKDKNTLTKDASRSINLPVAANGVIFKGGLVSTDATGFAVAASDTANEAVVGIADDTRDNTGGANGDLEVRVRKGTFELETAGTVVDQADAGRPVYVADDQTVEKIAGVTNNIVAGILDSLDVETGKPWVRVGVADPAAT